MKEQTSLQLNQSAQSAISVWLNSDNSLFSAIVESTVSNRQVLLIGHACLAFSALACMSCVSALPFLFCLTWFAWSLYLCRKGGIR